MSISAQAFTDAGRTMLGRANNGELLTFDTMVIGAGVAASTAALYPLVALIDHRFDVTITAKVDQGNGILVLDGVINSADIPAGQGFNLCELGLMAHIALEAPALYSVANVLATTPDYIPDAVENPTAVHAFKIKVVIDRATNVTVVLGTSTDIIAENMGPASVTGVAWPGVFHEKLANTLRFKRLTPGEKIEILEEPLDPFNITIGIKTLKNDLDLYVANGNPDISPDFSTIQNAFDYLKGFYIPSNLSARVYVAAGSYSIAQHITADHPNGDRISLLGPVVPDIAILGVTAVASNVVTLNVDDSSNCLVGNYLNVWVGAGGTTSYDGFKIAGFHVITAVAPGSVTIRIPLFALLTDFTGITGRATPVNTLVVLTTDDSGLVVDTELSMISGLGFIAVATPTLGLSGINAIGPTQLNYVGAYGFLSGYGAGFQTASKSTVLRCSFSRCQHGIVCLSGSIVNVSTVAVTHNLSTGIYALEPSLSFVPDYIDDTTSSCITAGNSEHGIYLARGYLTLVPRGTAKPKVYVIHNAQFGMYYANGAISSAGDAACIITFLNNLGTFDVVLNNFSIHAVFTGGTRRCNVAPSTASTGVYDVRGIFQPDAPA